MLEKISSEIINIFWRKKQLTDEQSDILQYFIQFLVFNLGGLILVYTSAAILNILIEVIVIHLSFWFLKQFSGGLHARKPSICLLVTCVLFLAIPSIFIKLSFALPIWLTVILFLVQAVLLAKYAPADTENNPLVYVKQRRNRKIISLGIISIYFLLSMVFKQYCIYLVYGSLVATLTALPLTYKIVKQKYRNYEDYVQM